MGQEQMGVGIRDPSKDYSEEKHKHHNKENLNILLIVSHPNVDKSFNHRLANVAKDVLTEKKHEVRYIDLYKMKWNPIGGKHDFHNIENKEFFDYQLEQKISVEKGFENFQDDVKEQIDNLKWADFIILQFPMIWFNIPTMLKGWCERVLAWHFAYSGKQNLKGKKVMFSITTGGPGYKTSQIDHFYSSLYQTFRYCQASVCDRFVCLGVNAKGFEGTTPIPPTEEDKKKWVEFYKKHLEKNVK